MTNDEAQFCGSEMRWSVRRRVVHDDSVIVLLAGTRREIAMDDLIMLCV